MSAELTAAWGFIALGRLIWSRALVALLLLAVPRVLLAICRCLLLMSAHSGVRALRWVPPSCFLTFCSLQCVLPPSFMGSMNLYLSYYALCLPVFFLEPLNHSFPSRAGNKHAKTTWKWQGAWHWSWHTCVCMALLAGSYSISLDGPPLSWSSGLALPASWAI